MMAGSAPVCASTGGQSSAAAKCPEHVMQAIYGKTSEKRKLYEQSLNRYAARGPLLAVWRSPHGRPVALLFVVAWASALAACAAGGRSMRRGRMTRRTSMWRTLCCMT